MKHSMAKGNDETGVMLKMHLLLHTVCSMQNLGQRKVLYFSFMMSKEDPYLISLFFLTVPYSVGISFVNSKGKLVELPIEELIWR